MSEGASIWLAVTAPGPVARSVMRLGPSACMRSASCLMFSTMSTTSSRTPSSEENSCTTPSIWMAVTAAPCRDDSSTRRRRVAERHAEAALERLGDDARLALAVGAGLDLRLLGADELVPVSFDHGWMSLETGDRRPLLARAGDGEVG